MKPSASSKESMNGEREEASTLDLAITATFVANMVTGKEILFVENTDIGIDKKDPKIE